MIMKINVIFIALLVVAIFGCTDYSKTIEKMNNSMQEKEHRIEQLQAKVQETERSYDSLSQSYAGLKEENANLLADVQKGMDLIDKIEKNLDFITTLERPLVYPAELEKRNKQSSIFSNIELIQRYIKNTNLLIKQLRDSTSMIPHFEKYITELTEKLEKKSIELQEIKSRVKNLEKELDNATATIEEQEKQIEELNRKYIIFVSKKETAMIDADGSYISIPFKFTTKDILTDHPGSSFTISQKKGSDYVLEIYNKDNFWRDGNYMIIKVNRKHLMAVK